MSINIDPAETVTVSGIGSEESPKIVNEYDANFEMELVKMKESATFYQDVLVSDPDEKITGYLEFMTCTNEKCLNASQLDFTLVPGRHGSGIWRRYY